jgi:hypothetical protein
LKSLIEDGKLEMLELDVSLTLMEAIIHMEVMARDLML